VASRTWIRIVGAFVAHLALVAGCAWGVYENLPEAGHIVFGPGPMPETAPTHGQREHARGLAEGEREAKADLAAGVLGWRIGGGYGLRMPEAYETSSMPDILSEDYGVIMKGEEGGGGCMLPRDLVYRGARLAAYNEVMQTALEKRYGKDVIERARKRAEDINAERRRKHAERQRDCKAGKGTGCEKIARGALPPRP